MTTQVVSDELASPLARRITPTFGYYRQANGWIKYATITRLERVKYEEEGWKYLPKYGAFDVTPYTTTHPLEGLFMFGGAHELPVEQVIQMGLYIDPPLVPRCRQHLTQFHRSHTANCWAGAVRVEFPQLADVPPGVLGPFVCDFCKRKLPTQEAREQHQSVAHSTRLSEVRTGKTLGTALSEALSTVNGQTEVDRLKAEIERLKSAGPSEATLKSRERMRKAREAKKARAEQAIAQ